MRRLSTILLLFLVLASQAQDEKKGLKSYYKGKFDKAEEEFSKIVRMFRFSALAHYGMALLYSDPAYPKADMFKAHEMMRTAVDKKKTIRPKKLEDVSKYFTPDSIDVLNKRINQSLYDSVMAKDSWKFTKNYLEKCKDGTFYSEVEKLAVHQQFRAVKDSNTVASYNWFIRKYPVEKQTEEATQLRNALAYTSTKQKNTLEAYQEYLDTYPDADEYNEAEKIRNKLAFEVAQKANTIEAYKAFLEEYQEAKEKAMAKEALVGLEFAKAKSANTDEAWDEFLKNYPENTKTSEAKKLREGLALSSAEKINTIEAFDYFMRKFPDSEYYPKAFNKKAELSTANFTFNLQEGASPSLIKVFDRFNTVATAVNHIKTSDGYLLLGKLKNTKRWYSDAWVVMIKSDGTLLWEKQLGGAYDDMLSHALAVKDGFVLAGYTKGKSSTDRELWFVKLDKKGKTVWEKTADGVQIQGIVSQDDKLLFASTILDEDKMHQLNLVQLDPEGNLKANQKHTSVGFPKGITKTATGEIFVATQKNLLKIDSRLAISQNIEFSKGNSAYNIKALADGLYVVGRFYDYKKVNKSDFWLAKYSADAQVVWEKTYDNTKQQDIAYDLAQSEDGSLMLVGLSEKAKTDNLHILKLANDGTQQAALILGTNNSEKKPTVQSGEGLSLFLSSGVDSDLVFLKL